MTKSVAISALMDSSGVKFGTSGARGLVINMTDLVCFAYTCAFLQHLKGVGQFKAGERVAIAGDLRPSTPRIIKACTAAVRHMGGLVEFCGYVPSPAVAGYGFARKMPSMMVTGSHIPADRNGIKFNRADGEILKTDEAAMRSQEVELPDLFDAAGSLHCEVELEPTVDVTAEYLQRYIEFFGPEALKGMRLGIYEHSAVGRDILVTLVEALGGKSIRLGRSDTFVPVDTEAVREEDQAAARQWAREYELDAILSTDGDSDRPLLADETGEWLRGDILGILCAKALAIEAVATPVTSNTALELCGEFPRISRTRIGSPYVIEAMNAFISEGLSVCGYEANGGFILGSSIFRDGRSLSMLPTRDAMLPMITILVEANYSRNRVSDLHKQVPDRYTSSICVKNVAPSVSEDFLESISCGDMLENINCMFESIAGPVVALDNIDGLRMVFRDGHIIHIRPSGNAPELRCYTESSAADHAFRLSDQTRIILETVITRHSDELFRSRPERDRAEYQR